jgi:hypothetical protein
MVQEMKGKIYYIGADEKKRNKNRIIALYLNGVILVSLA